MRRELGKKQLEMCGEKRTVELGAQVWEWEKSAINSGMSLNASLVIGRIQIKVLNTLAFLSLFNFSFPREQIQNLKGRINGQFIFTPQWNFKCW